VVELVCDVDLEIWDQVGSTIRAAGLKLAWTADLLGGAMLRTVAALVNEAFFALEEGVVSAPY